MSAVGLVVRRELREKLRSTAFWVANGVLVALLVAAVSLPALLGDDDPTTVRVVPVGDDAVAVVELAASLALDGEDVRIERVDAADEEAAEDLLVAEVAELALLGTDEVVGLSAPGGPATDLLLTARRIVLLDTALAEAGATADEREAAISPSPMTLTSLRPDEDDGGPSVAAVGTGLTAVFVLYALLIFYGQQIAQGIVQEKQSRVIEVLLATMRPVELLGGKLLGLGLLGLLQVAVLAVVGLGALAVTGREAVPPEAVPTLLVAVAFFVLGYAMYATIFALAAAVVAKVEDLQTAMTIPIILLVGSLFLAQFALAVPDGTLALVGSLLPPSAPIVQPLLVAVGEADPLRIALSVVGVVATTAVLVPVTARVHAGAALVTRQRISVGDALRRHRD